MTDETETLKDVISVSELIHSPVRLAIIMFLLPRISASFPEIQRALDLTSGNLASHIKKMERGKLVEVRKEFIAAKPTTIVTLTTDGEKAIDEYSNILRNMLNMMEKES